MARHTEDGHKGGSKGKCLIQPVVPALPLRPMKRRPTSNKAQESRPVETVIEDGTSERLLSGGQGTPDRALKIQFGELQGDVDHFGADSPASFNETNSSGDVATSPLPSSMCALRQLWTLNAQNALPDASNNDTLTQATSSRPSSAPPTLKFPSDDLAHDPRQPLQTSVVELPAEASISRSSSLKISFLYQEDLDSASQASTPYSGSPTLSVLPAMSHLPPTMHGTSLLHSQSSRIFGSIILRSN